MHHSAWVVGSVLVVSLVLALGVSPARADDGVTLVEDGRALAVIHVPERLWDDPDEAPEPGNVWRGERSDEDQRRRLRESVRDFVGIVERMSGATLEVKVGAPAGDDARVPILVGELAAERFGDPAERYPYGQGFRIVVADGAVGLVGESDLAVSYALYTLLHELGCRWYIPSELGEVLPALATIALAARDDSLGPHTVYRGVWYADNDYGRRNRMGGLEVTAAHALEHRIPNELREQHPEIRAVIDGEPHPIKVKWTHPLVIGAWIDRVRGQLEENPDRLAFSLSPMDGIGWDEELDPEHDADDFDPSAGTVSKTDRLMVFANSVAEAVTADYPDALFGLLAYVDYTRPPVREPVHPNLVPTIAPITYSRAHPMTDEGEPNNAALRGIVTGWGEVARWTSYYYYAFFLAEVSAPNPMITKWSIDVPMAFDQGAARFWRPETMPNFETTMHAIYMGNRMAWDPSQDPAEIIDELHRKFYGSAASEMADYWHEVDRIWIETPEYSGRAWGYLRRFTDDRLAGLRERIDAALDAVATQVERDRIALAEESLSLFEKFMRMRVDLAEGRFENLEADAEAYIARMIAAGERHADQFAFARVRWGRDRNVNITYFRRYHGTYVDATRIAADYDITTPTIREFRYRADEDARGEDAGWHEADHDDRNWPTTDVGVETWSSLGYHNYMGRMWYRTRVDVPAVDSDRRVYLWIASTDGSARVYVNGEHVPFVDDEGETADHFSGYGVPASFDITDVVQPGGENQITILCERIHINELGSGGLLDPLVIYTDR